MNGPAHLIEIKDGKPGVSCGADWIGANITKDVTKVRCERCTKTAYYKKQTKG